MTYGTVVMFVVGAVFVAAGIGLLVRLASSRITERKTYAYRMVGIMFASAGVLLIAYALALRSWSMTP
jgi:hydrogenase/urease accessory protein HupE